MKKYTFLKQSLYFKNLPKMLDLELIPLLVGFERCNPQKNCLHFQKKHYVIHFILEGKGTVETNKKQYSVSKNMLFIIPPGKDISYWPDKNDPWQYIWIETSGEQCPATLAIGGIHQNTFLLQPSHAKQIRGLFLDMIEESFETRASITLGILAKFLQVLDLLSYDNSADNAFTTLSNVNTINFVQTAIEYLEKNYFDPNLSIAQLAETLNFSIPYVSKIFKKSLGIPPRQYLTNIRMRHACELLAAQTYSISEIARSVGYSSPYYFSNNFKQIYGIAPSLYKTETSSQIKSNN